MTNPPYPHYDTAKAIDDEYGKDVAESIGERTSQVFCTGNIQSFKHGRGWTFSEITASGNERKEGEMRLQSIEGGIPISEVLDMKMEVIAKSIEEFSEKWMNLQMENLFEIVKENSPEIPNERLVEPAELNTLMNGLKSVGCSVGRDGKTSMPTLALPDPTTFMKKVDNQLRSNPELRDAFEKLKAEKEQEAREREAARLAKFRILGDE